MAPRRKGYYQDVRLLSVHEICVVLATAKIDYSGAVEKKDLIELAIAADLFFDWSSYTPFPIMDLPEELVMTIFTFLDIPALLNCCLVSHAFKSYASDDALWLPFCRDRWRGRFNTRKELRRVEAPPSVFGSRMRLYGQLELDSRRQAIRDDELCTYPWLFIFKRFDHSIHNPIAQWTCTPERTLTIDGMDTMRWRWVQEGVALQVEQYPPLRVKRTADWGWTLENLYVIFTAMAAEDSSSNHPPSSATPAAKKR